MTRQVGAAPEHRRCLSALRSQLMHLPRRVLCVICERAPTRSEIYVLVHMMLRRGLAPANEHHCFVNGHCIIACDFCTALGNECNRTFFCMQSIDCILIQPIA